MEGEVVFQLQRDRGMLDYNRYGSVTYWDIGNKDARDTG